MYCIIIAYIYEVIKRKIFQMYNKTDMFEKDKTVKIQQRACNYYFNVAVVV